MSEEKKGKTYHFNFTVETPQPISEENQKEISEALKEQLNLKLLNKGYYTALINIDNEFYCIEDLFVPPEKDRTSVFATIHGAHYIIDVPTVFVEDIRRNNDVIDKELFDKMKKYEKE